MGSSKMNLSRRGFFLGGAAAIAATQLPSIPGAIAKAIEPAVKTQEYTFSCYVKRSGGEWRRIAKTLDLPAGTDIRRCAVSILLGSDGDTTISVDGPVGNGDIIKQLYPRIEAKMDMQSVSLWGMQIVAGPTPYIPTTGAAA
jgi:hypothetical protein